MQDKIQQYYRLLKLRDVLNQEINNLNEEIKTSYEPGEHKVGDYKINISVRRRFEIPDPDALLEWLGPGQTQSCIKEVVDPNLLESEYLAGHIRDDVMRSIRGEAKIITSLKVEKDE